MGSPLASVAGRVLSPCSTLTGADGGALQNQNPRFLTDGTLCFVRAERALYELRLFSTEAVSSPRVIATVYGAGVPGRWVQIAGSAASLEPIQTMLFCDASFTGTPTGSIAAPFPTLQQALDAVPASGGGSILMAVGSYPGAWSVPAKTVNIYVMGGAQGGAGGGVILPAGTLQNGAAVRLDNVALAGGLTLEGTGSLFAWQVGFSNQNILQSGAGGWAVRIASDGIEPSDPGNIEASTLIGTLVEFQGVISLSGATARLIQCTLENDLVFTGAAGALSTDLYTLNSMRLSGAILTNGTATAFDAPSVHETVALPAFGAAGTQTVDVPFTDAEPGDSFVVSLDVSALPANLSLASPSCVASNSVRLIVVAVGASAGGDVDLVITRLNGGQF